MNKFTAGQKVTTSGFAGTVVRIYSEEMVEVRLASGLTCVPVGDVVITDTLMDVQVIQSYVKQYANLGRYFYSELRCGKQHMTVVIAPDHVQACVHNASNRAWRGMGKHLRNMEEARTHYRSAEVRAMLGTAERLNNEAQAVQS